MKATVPALAPLLRSDAQGDLLAELFLNPDDEFSLSDLTRIVGAHLATVHREIDRLVVAGLLHDHRVGRARMVRANIDHELAKPLAELLLLSYGPRVVLRPLVHALEGAADAYIYGSWARRYVGEAGPAPRDIDVLIVGTASRTDLARLGRAAQERLRKEVNVTRVSVEDWREGRSPFVQTLRRGPLLKLLAEGDDR